MNLIPSRCSLALLALTLASTTLNAQSKKKLTDWLNVQTGGKQITIQVNSQAIGDAIFNPLRKTNAPAAPTPNASEPANAPASSTVATATPPPAGESVPPPASPRATSEAGSPDAVAPSPATPENSKPAEASAGWMQRISVVPLTNIQSLFEAIKAVPECRSSFVVSVDGLHCASLKRLGLTAWTVQIDGQPGPEFTKIRNDSSALFPSVEFDRVLYVAFNAASEPKLVIQNRDGSAKIYPIANEPALGTWFVDVTESLSNRRLIRKRRSLYNPDNIENRYGQKVETPVLEIQIDENGPVVGPFVDSSPVKIIFDSNQRHYLISGKSPFLQRADKASNSGYRGRPCLFRDGKQVLQDFLTELAPNVYGELQAERFITDDGHFFARYAWSPMQNQKREAIIAAHGAKGTLNGARPINYPGGINPSQQVFSPDGQRVAEVLPDGQNRGIYLDGSIIASQPASAEIQKLRFTEDSQGIDYAAGSSGQVGVFVDGQKQPVVTGMFVKGLWAGPHRGQFAAVVRNQTGAWDLVVNGRVLPLSAPGDASKNDFRPQSVSWQDCWFTADGNHVFGFCDNGFAQNAYFVDNRITRIDFAGKPLKLVKRLSATRQGDARCQMVGATQEGNYFRVEIESPLP